MQGNRQTNTDQKGIIYGTGKTDPEGICNHIKEEIQSWRESVRVKKKEDKN